MAKAGVAKLFRNGRSQAVRLPREFRFDSPKTNSIWAIANVVMLDPDDLTHDTETEHGKPD